MADKKNDSGFTVTDRRLFTSQGDLRNDVPEEVEQKPEAASAPKEQMPKAPPSAGGDGAAMERDMPTPPTSAEQEAQAAAYHQSSKDLDKEVELSGHSAKDFEITFERFMASLYMTAMLQLGLMRQQNEQPRGRHHWRASDDRYTQFDCREDQG